MLLCFGVYLFVTTGKQGNALSTQKLLCVVMVFCVYCKVMYMYVNNGNTYRFDYTIKIPPRLKKRGRSIDAKLTVVGLPRKCQNHGKPVFVMKKMHTEKEKSKYFITQHTYH